jgi:serine/threonine protein kinase
MSQDTPFIDQSESPHPIQSKGNLRYRPVTRLLKISSGTFWSAIDVRRGGDVTIFYPQFKVSVDDQELKSALNKAISQSATLRETGYHVARDIACDELGHYFLVFDRPQGQPLALLLRERKTLDLNTTLSVMIQLCELLHRAHELGLFAVTLTPHNILVSQRPNGALRVGFIDLTLDRRPLSTWIATPPIELSSPPHAMLTQEKDRRHFAVYLCSSLLHQLVFGVEPKAPTTLGDSRVWPTLPTHGKELDERLEACLHTILLKGLSVTPQDRFPRVTALQRSLIGLRQLISVSSPAFELLASTQARLGRQSGTFNLSAPRPGVEHAVKVRQRIHQILEERDANLTLEDVLKAEGGTLLR